MGKRSGDVREFDCSEIFVSPEFKSGVRERKLGGRKGTLSRLLQMTSYTEGLSKGLKERKVVIVKSSRSLSKMAI